MKALSQQGHQTPWEALTSTCCPGNATGQASPSQGVEIRQYITCALSVYFLCSFCIYHLSSVSVFPSVYKSIVYLPLIYHLSSVSIFPVPIYLSICLSFVHHLSLCHRYLSVFPSVYLSIICLPIICLMWCEQLYIQVCTSQAWAVSYVHGCRSKYHSVMSLLIR